MAYPVRNPNVNPFTYISEAAIQNLCAYLGAALPTVDQFGATLQISLGADQRSITAGTPTTYQVAVVGEAGPAVAVSMESWGRQDFIVGMGAFDQSPGLNQVWTVAVAGTGLGGVFYLGFGGTTAYSNPLSANSATAAQVSSALQAIAAIGTGGVNVTGGPLTASGGTFTVTATTSGAIAAQALGNLTADASQMTGTGAAVTPTIATTGTPMGQLTLYNIAAYDCIFLLEVYAILYAQRQYIVDSLLAEVPFAFYQPASGPPIENAIIQGMYARGVMLHGWRSAQLIRPKFEEPRPAGQYYKAEMRLRADIEQIVAIPKVAVPGAKVTITATSGSASRTGPTIVVTPNTLP